MQPLAPGSMIGILGSGQLGRMQVLAAARLGLKCHVYSDHTGPAFDVAAAGTVGSFTDLDRVADFARDVDVVTYEFENVPIGTAAACAAHVAVHPGPKALEVSQDRLTEKSFITALGLPVAPFAAVDDPASLEAALARLGNPAILKTRRFGYDGKGQARINKPHQAAGAWDGIGQREAILEGLVRFSGEVSVLVVRGQDGEKVFYDCPLNRHERGILARSSVPSGLAAADEARAREIAAAIADALDYVGVLAVEFFYVPGASEPLVVNEIAPRVHNSGHWTLDACPVSQFENHIRAIAGWPLGTTARHSDAVMDNLIGPEALEWAVIAGERGACLHLYGKNDARPGRKMGHVTRLSPCTRETTA